MTGEVTLPVWLFVLLVALALWAALDRLLLPGVRWYLRRKVNRVIRQINVRLNVELPQFKLTRRQVLIDRLFHDPIYPEGGLTLDGKLRRPRLGLLDYLLKTFDPRGERDLVFIPVGINYDRVLEDRTLLDSKASARTSTCRVETWTTRSVWVCAC